MIIIGKCYFPECRICVHLYLCKVKRFHSWLHWSSRPCSPGRTPPYNRYHSCISRSLLGFHHHHTARFRDTDSPFPPHRLDRKPKKINLCFYNILLEIMVFIFQNYLVENKTAASPLQSGPKVPFGQHTLMLSMQNHLCKSGCFVFL